MTRIILLFASLICLTGCPMSTFIAVGAATGLAVTAAEVAMDEAEKSEREKQKAANKNDPYFTELVWCVSDSNVSRVVRRYCYESLDGTVYSSEAEALKALAAGQAWAADQVWCVAKKHGYMPLKMGMSSCSEHGGNFYFTKSEAESKAITLRSTGHTL